MPTRRRVTILNFFPAFTPPRSGGELRYYHLATRLGRHYDVTMVSPTHPFAPREIIPLAEHVVEHRIPKSWRHKTLEGALHIAGGFTECSAVVVSLISHVEKDYKRAVMESRSNADIVIHEFPFLLRHARKQPGQLLIYDAHNVEFDLQRAILRGPLGRLLCQYVRRLESLACNESDLILATSPDDKRRLVELYHVHPDKIFVVPNGVDTRSVRYVSDLERRQAKVLLDIDGLDTLLFIGSFHPPNIEAVHSVISLLAPASTEKIFLIAGDVARAIPPAGLPPNVICLGRVSDDAKTVLLRAADIALNPVLSGSGTNLKMLDYLAAGLPVVTTAVGARGLDLVNGVHAIVSPLDRFPESIEHLLKNEHLRTVLRSKGRQLAEEQYDWDNIVDRMYAVTDTFIARMLRAT